MSRTKGIIKKISSWQLKNLLGLGASSPLVHHRSSWRSNSSFWSRVNFQPSPSCTFTLAFSLRTWHRWPLPTVHGSSPGCFLGWFVLAIWDHLNNLLYQHKFPPWCILFLFPAAGKIGGQDRYSKRQGWLLSPALYHCWCQKCHWCRPSPSAPKQAALGSCRGAPWPPQQEAHGQVHVCTRIQILYHESMSISGVFVKSKLPFLYHEDNSFQIYRYTNNKNKEILISKV